MNNTLNWRLVWLLWAVLSQRCRGGYSPLSSFDDPGDGQNEESCIVISSDDEWSVSIDFSSKPPVLTFPIVIDLVDTSDGSESEREDNAGRYLEDSIEDPDSSVESGFGENRRRDCGGQGRDGLSNDAQHRARSRGASIVLPSSEDLDDPIQDSSLELSREWLPRRFGTMGERGDNILDLSDELAGGEMKNARVVSGSSELPEDPIQDSSLELSREWVQGLADISQDSSGGQGGPDDSQEQGDFWADVIQQVEQIETVGAGTLSVVGGAERGRAAFPVPQIEAWGRFPQGPGAALSKFSPIKRNIPSYNPSTKLDIPRPNPPISKAPRAALPRSSTRRNIFKGE